MFLFTVAAKLQPIIYFRMPKIQDQVLVVVSGDWVIVRGDQGSVSVILDTSY